MARNPSSAATTAITPAKPDDPIVKAIESALDHYGISNIATLGKVQQMIRMAEGIQALRAAITNEFVMSTIMPLYGTPLGFLADRPNTKVPQPYSIDVVKDCVIEGLIRGFNVVGNEMNIIGGRFYGTKNGFERQCAEFPGLTDLVMQPGVPAFGQHDTQNARVPFTATWRLHGKPMKLECHALKDGPDNRIPVRVNDGMGLDAVIGKAHRKMYFRIYSQLHGSTFGLIDGDVTDQPIDTTGTTAPVPAAGEPRKRGAFMDQVVADAKKATKSEPPAAPANDAVSPEQVFRELSAATASWAELDPEQAKKMVASWSAADQRAAFEWARACNEPDGSGNDELPPRPDCTVLERQPGED